MGAQGGSIQTEYLVSFRTNVAQADELVLAVVPGGLLRTFRPAPILRGIFRQDRSEIERIVKLGHETVPTILLIHLIIAFEAYWEDLAIAILSAHPHLFPTAEASMGMGSPTVPPAPPIGPPQPPMGPEARTLRLFFTKGYDILVQGLWDQGLGLPLSAICQAEGTSAQELDRAKVIRNLHIHNRGLVTQRYLDRTLDQTRNIGDPMPVTTAYAKEIKTKLSSVVAKLDEAAIVAYPQIV